VHRPLTLDDQGGSGGRVHQAWWVLDGRFTDCGGYIGDMGIVVVGGGFGVHVCVCVFVCVVSERVAMTL
jgi:hypothetical protein